MEKFVGTVNGKSFDNRDDFEKAAIEATKNNDGNLSITSYVSYVDDDLVEDKKDVNNVDSSEYLIPVGTEPKIDDETGEYCYELPKELADKLLNATNKDEILSTVNACIDGIKSRKNQLFENISGIYNELLKESAKKDYYNMITELFKEKELPKSKFLSYILSKM